MRNLKNMRREGGFTLIELLVVVVITVALAAIAVPLYVGQTEVADEASAKNGLSNISGLLVAAIGANAVDDDIADADEQLVYDGRTVSTAGFTGSFSMADGTFCYDDSHGTGDNAVEASFHVSETDREPAAGGCA